MQTVSEFLELVSCLDSKDITCIFKTSQSLSKKDLLNLLNKNCAIETDNYLNVLSACSEGFCKDNIYFDVTCASANNLEKIIGKCRIVISSFDILDTINQKVRECTDNIFIESIAIRVIPDETNISYDTQGIYMNQLNELSSRLKKLDHLAIRGIFINPPSMSHSPSSKIKEYFSTIKNIRSWLPCTFSYFCMENVTHELSDSIDNSLCDNLDLICLLNNTSLYSEFLLS